MKPFMISFLRSAALQFDAVSDHIMRVSGGLADWTGERKKYPF